LIVACVADEEYMSAGAEAFVREYHADMAIVTEPTDLVLAVGHKGFTWIDVVAHGRAAHGSRPDEGRDAIARMGRVLGALEARDRELRARAPVAFQGTGSLHASFISGGRELSSYPDRCTMTYERRTVEGETDDVVRAEIEELLAMLRAADPEFAAEATLAGGRSPYRLDPRHPLPRAVANALQKAGRSAEPGGMSFWTDAAILAGAGIPSVLFGPGGAGLHSVEEYVTVQDLYTCRDVLTETVRTLLEAAG
jgi:acetylornithine deacetylase